MTNDGAPTMTKYEATTLVGVRMEQLALGAPSTLPAEVLETMKDVREIARDDFIAADDSSTRSDRFP